MKLYEIDNKLKWALEMCCDTDTGEIKDTELLESLEMLKEEKVLNCGRMIKNWRAEAKAIKEEEDNLKIRRKRLEKSIQDLESYLRVYALGESYEDSNTVVNWSKSSRVDIYGDIPNAYYKIKREPDKQLIKDNLKAGELIDGAKIIECFNLQIK